MELSDRLWQGISVHVKCIVDFTTVEQEIYLILRPVTSKRSFSRQTIAVAEKAFDTEAEALEAAKEQGRSLHKTSVTYRNTGTTIAIARGQDGRVERLVCRFTSEQFLDLTFTGYLCPEGWGGGHRLK